MGQIRWGIMGAGGIAGRFARALAHVEGARLVAISGRRAERLDAFAGEFHVDAAKRYASAEDNGASAHLRLVEDPDVDAVYLALPHGMHEEWTVRLLRAGKAVLCEKPAVLSEREAAHVAEVAHETGSLFMEAMKPRFMPACEQVDALLARGDLGAIASIDIVHRVNYGDQTGRYLLDPVQGGTLYDLGCYGVGWAEDLLAGEVEVDSCRTRWMPAAEGGCIDIADDARLRIGGVPVHFDFAGDADEFEVVCRICCERGEIEVPVLHRPVSYVVRKFVDVDGERMGIRDADAGESAACGNVSPELVEAPAVVDDFYGEIAHFCGLMRAGAHESSVMPLASTVRIARTIDAIRASWPPVGQRVVDGAPERDVVDGAFEQASERSVEGSGR